MIRRRIKLSPKQIKRKAHKLIKSNGTEHPNFSTAAVVRSLNDNGSTLTSNDKLENQHFPHLFKPLDLGPAIGSLPNRVIMGSMHTGLEVRYSIVFFP